MIEEKNDTKNDLDKKPSNPFAFPVFIPKGQDGDEYCFGMTIRDYFAGKAINGILSGIYSSAHILEGFAKLANETQTTFKNEISERAYRIADAMLKERVLEYLRNYNKFYVRKKRVAKGLLIS